MDEQEIFVEKLLKDYTIEKKWDEGPLITVFEGICKRDKEAVRLYQFKKNEFKSDLPLLIRERVLEFQKIECPHLPQIDEIIQLDDSLLVSEKGCFQKNLSTFFVADQTDLERFFHIGRQILEALIQLNKKNIVHGRLNPYNIYIDESNTSVKLGMPWFQEGGIHKNIPVNNPVFLDIFPFVSPEQTGRTVSQVDHRSDLYSFGAALYYFLTGTPPFQGDDALEIMHKILAVAPSPLKKTNIHTPDLFLRILDLLLQKNPDERYQNVHGLLFDMNFCLQDQKNTGSTSPVRLKTQDFSPTIVFPKTVLGREQEFTKLKLFYEMVQKGAMETIFVSGFSGIGKSCFVQQLEPVIFSGGGLFVSGKFNKHTEGVPFNAVITAFTSLINGILLGSKKEVLSWRKKINLALGNTGKVITDVIPELSTLIGPQAPVPSLGPLESENRFILLFKRFFQVFASKKRPLIFFLDDLQWADRASIQLLLRLSTSREIHSVLIIGAFRSNEVNSSHILQILLEKHKIDDVLINEISLKGWEEGNIGQFVEKVLPGTRKGEEGLAHATLVKTGGNPFYVKQFLLAHVSRKNISFSPEKGWYWNLEQINSSEITENISDYLIETIKELPHQTQTALQFAGLLGKNITARKLSFLSNEAEEDVSQQIDWFVENGYFVAKKDSVLFSHDKIQEAAYQCIPEPQKAGLHYTYGKWLFENIAEKEHEEHLFEILTHLNKDVESLVNEEEKDLLKTLNIRGAQKAKQSNAFKSAAAYYSTAARLLPEDCWEKDHDRTFHLFKDLYQCELMNGSREIAHTLYQEIFKKVQTNLEKGEIMTIRLDHLATETNFTEAVKVGLETVKLFGKGFPETGEAMGLEIGKMAEQLSLESSKKGLLDIEHAPVIEDREEVFRMALFCNIISSAYNVDQILFAFTVYKTMLFILEKGVTEKSFIPIQCYGIINILQGEYEFSYLLGMAAQRKVREYKLTQAIDATDFFNAAFIFSWKLPVRKTSAQFQKLLPSFLDHGDFLYAGYAGGHIASQCLTQGGRSKQTLERLQSLMDTMISIESTASFEILRLVKQFYLNLEGRTASECSLSDDTFNEEKSLEVWSDTNFSIVTTYYYIIKMQLLFIRKKYEEALDMAEKAFQMSVTTPGNVVIVDIHVFRALSLLALSKSVAGERQKKGILEQLKCDVDALKKFAALCPENFGHRYMLVSAEKEKFLGHTNQAMALYNSAAENARKEGFYLQEALALELSSQFYFELENSKVGIMYLIDTFHSYSKLGAVSKANALKREYKSLQRFQEKVKGDQQKMFSIDLFDAASIIKSSHTISFESTFKNMVKKLLKIIVEAGGADKGLLLIKNRDGFSIEAEFYLPIGQKGSSKGLSVKNAPSFPQSVIRMVEGTGKPLAMSRDEVHQRFGSDRYFKKNSPLSFLCLPMLKQKKMIAILYLENQYLEDFFSKERVDFLHHISTQAAFSIENAKLYENLNREIEKHKETQGKLRQFSRKLVEAQELERERIARELHDSLAQNIMLVKSYLRRGVDDCKDPVPESVKKLLNDGMDVLSQTLGHVREISYSLRPAQLDLLGLEKATRALMKKISCSFPISMDCMFSLGSFSVPKEMEIHIFRIIQEGVNNIIKHSGAHRGSIEFVKKNSIVNLVISDEGKGFSLEKDKKASLGLQGIEERAGLFGGSLKVDSAEGKGTTLKISFPDKGASPK